MTDVAMPRPRFDGTINLGHVLTILALLAAGLSVYVGVFQTLTGLVVRVNALETIAGEATARRAQIVQNTTEIAELKGAISDIRSSNSKIVEILTGVRIDLAVIGKQQAADPPGH